MEIYKQKTWLVQKYWNEKLTSVEMAKLCGTCHATILYWMNIHNLVKRKPGTRKGREITKEQREKHSIAMSGKCNPRWKGGKSSYYREHARKKWEMHYGYSIPKGFLVHHIDRNIKNNNIENLVLLTYKSHFKVHSIN